MTRRGLPLAMSQPTLAASMNLASAIRANNGLKRILQPSKLRASLAERSVQTVRGQAKTFIAYAEHKAFVALPQDHVLRAWAMCHAAWLLNRYHVSITAGVAAFMALRGGPYNGKICSFADVVYALDPLQAEYMTQWRAGIWLGRDEADRDIVCVSENEVPISKAIRKVSQTWDARAMLAMIIGPWDMRRGVHTRLRAVQPLPRPQLLSLDHAEEDEDVDALAVKKYAAKHPEEDAEQEEDDPA